jgi:protein-disulfide isomerase/uncharacterized membrane protein
MKPLQKGLLLLAGLNFVAAAGLFAANQAGWDLAALLVAGLALSAALVVSNPRTGILVTALFCMLANFYLLAGKIAAATGPSRCSINEVFNCDLVNQSAASEIFGIPVTLLGAAFYAGVALAALGDEERSPFLGPVVTNFSVLALLYSGYLAYQTKVIGAVCIVCISIYVGNAILLWAGTRTTTSANKGALGLTSRSFLTVAGVFLVLTGLGMAGYSGKTTSPLETLTKEQLHDPATLAKLYAQPTGKVSLDGTEQIYGDPNAPYILVEWADYGCPHCADAAPELKRLVNERPEIQLRFKAFPRTGECNPKLEPSGFLDLCHAAYAAECAGEQDKFWEMNAMLFANIGHQSDDNIRFMANQLGLDEPKFLECMVAEATHEGIVADATAGTNAGVKGTPSIFLKGTHGPGWIEMTLGPLSALRVVEAHLDGIELPQPSPPIEHGHPH